MPVSCTLTMSVRSPSCTTATFSAPLRRVRTAVRPPPGCAPRIECGSWVSPATTLFMARWSAASGEVICPVTGKLLTVGGLADQPGDGPQRDPQPAGPVPGFVSGLVDRLVQFVRGQQRALVARVQAGRVRVPVAERRAV